MIVDLYWIATPTAGRLATMARPRGEDWLEDEIRFLAQNGVDTLVSLLTDTEANELGLHEEAACCAEQQIAFVRFPIADFTTPPLNEHTFALLEQLAQLLKAGNTVTIHCRMGIGRSSLVAASVLALCGTPVDTAFATISAARRLAVPDTAEQYRWVEQFANKYA